MAKGLKIALICSGVLGSLFILTIFLIIGIAFNQAPENNNTSDITNSDTLVEIDNNTKVVEKVEEKEDYTKCLNSVKSVEEKALITVRNSAYATQEDEDWIIDYYAERKESCKVFKELKSVDELKPDTEDRSIYYKNCVESVYEAQREWRDKIIASWYNGEGIEETLEERERAMQYLYEECEKR